MMIFGEPSPTKSPKAKIPEGADRRKVSRERLWAIADAARAYYRRATDGRRDGVYFERAGEALEKALAEVPAAAGSGTPRGETTMTGPSPTRKRKRKLKRISSPAQIAANRIRRWRHGGRSKVVTAYEGRMAQLRKIDPELPEIIAAVIAAGAGDLEKLQRLGLQALAEMEVLRRLSVEQIHRDGVVVEDQVLDRDGKVVGTRKKAHPLMENTRHFHDVLGFTAEQMQLTAKSRGQGEKDAAMTKLLARQAMLRAADKSRMPPPPKSLADGAIDVTPDKPR